MKYNIIGGSMQTLDVELASGEKIYGDSGKLVSKSENVIMMPRLVGGVIGAVERKITGATAMLTEFTPKTLSGIVSLSGVMPGKIKAIELGEGEAFIAEHYAFLAAQDSVKFTIQTVSLGAAFFGGAGLILQKFEGPGMVFIHTVGDLIEYKLDGTRGLEVDPGHIAGFDATLEYKIGFVDNIRTAMFGGVGLFLAKFSGNGRVILHSVSRFKFSSEIFISGYQQNKDIVKKS
ncbi:MAG: TIGR00266 family protein [Candidatus Micrarchaeia archaeon]